MQLTLLGHASWKITTRDQVIYLDPYEGEYKDKATLILSTHSHQDHCKPDVLKQALAPDTTIIAPKDCASKYSQPIKSLKPSEKLKVGTTEIEAVEAYNTHRFRSPGQPFHPQGLGVGYLIHAEGKTIYHTGDTDHIPEMAKLRNIDAMLLPSGGTYTMDNDEAAEAILTVKPKLAFPMHTWDTDPNQLKRKIEAATSTTKVVILKKGETYAL
jgi:L-ascorbate metabolism protein UlaG (beta-lactamase superfamily)